MLAPKVLGKLCVCIYHLVHILAVARWKKEGTCQSSFVLCTKYWKDIMCKLNQKKIFGDIPK
jgi:hypothetical protein